MGKSDLQAGPGEALESITEQEILNEIDKWKDLDKRIKVMPVIHPNDITKDDIMERYHVSEREAQRLMKDMEKEGLFDCIQVRSGRGQKPWVLRRKIA